MDDTAILGKVFPDRELLDNLSDGVCIADSCRRIIAWNKGAESITGYAGAEIVGSRCCDNLFMHMDDDGRRMCHESCPMLAPVRLKKAVFNEASLMHRNGFRVPVAIKTFPVFGDDGEVCGTVQIFHDKSSSSVLKARLGELEKTAMVDHLTGLANRRYLEKGIAVMLDEAWRLGTACGFCFLDIDGFKLVNDSHGHACGDLVLKMVAETLINASRAFDLPGRWGGDEFVVTIKNASDKQMIAIAERYRLMIAGSMVPGPGGGHISVTVSIGVTQAMASDTPSSLLKRADSNMYRAKQAGRNRVASDIPRA